MLAPPDASEVRCRSCGAPLSQTLVDLGMSPPCESFLTAAQIEAPETFYPLHVRVCAHCLLVQIPECLSAGEIFGDYAYFSSYSSSWLAHARTYSERMIERFGLGPTSFVVELASNDGYLLRNFVAAGIPCLGIEPSFTVAEAARALVPPVPTLEAFFGVETATKVAEDPEHGKADLIAANNVLAHVPDILDFVRGAARLLKEDGVVTYEFPHLARLIEDTQYDTIYHEHFSYLSLRAVQGVFQRAGLEVFDVETLPSHGGSLRVFGQVQGGKHAHTDRIEEVLELERSQGLDTAEGNGYRGFQSRVEASKRSVLRGLIQWREELGETGCIAAYGAPGKGNTLLNYCGIRADLIDFAVDRNPYKHGRFTPGTHIPIFPEEELRERRPGCIVILPWNLEKEIAKQLEYTREWGARLFVPIPEWREVQPR